MKRSNKEGVRNSGETRARDGRSVRDRSKVKCWNCFGYGHYAAECRKPRRENNREQRTKANLIQITDSEPALLFIEARDNKDGMVMLNEEKVVLAGRIIHGETNVWYLNNGASNHMSRDRSKFKTLDTTVAGKVRFGDGSTVNIEGKGSVVFKCKNGETRTLNEVYFIPTLCSNIISLGQLSEIGNKIMLNEEYLWVSEKSGKLLMKVQRSSNRLYKLIVESDRDMCLLTKKEEVSWLWHSRLGHVNFQAMQLMSKNNMVRGIPSFYQPKEVCRGCLLSKQTRKSFPAQSDFTVKGFLNWYTAICVDLSLLPLLLQIGIFFFWLMTLVV